MENAVRQRVKTWLSKIGMSEGKLAENIGTSQANVNRWLKSTPIPASFVLKLLQYFPNMSAEWLLRGNGDMKKSLVDRLLDGGCGDIGIYGDNASNNNVSVGGSVEIGILKDRIKQLEAENQKLEKQRDEANARVDNLTDVLKNITTK